MGLPQHTDRQGDDGEVTTLFDVEYQVNRTISALHKLIHPDTTQYKAYRQLSLPIRYSTFISILVCLNELKIGSKSNVVVSTKRDPEFIGKAVDCLYEAGYLVKVGRARLIKPFKRHKIDTHYSLSEKGMKTVRDYVLEVLADLPATI